MDWVLSALWLLLLSLSLFILYTQFQYKSFTMKNGQFIKCKFVFYNRYICICICGVIVRIRMVVGHVNTFTRYTISLRATSINFGWTNCEYSPHFQFCLSNTSAQQWSLLDNIQKKMEHFVETTFLPRNRNRNSNYFISEVVEALNNGCIIQITKNIC